MPSLTERSLLPDRVTIGATLLTVTTTTWLSVSEAPSESVTVAVTLVRGRAVGEEALEAAEAGAGVVGVGPG